MKSFFVEPPKVAQVCFHPFRIEFYNLSPSHTVLYSNQSGQKKSKQYALVLAVFYRFFIVFVFLVVLFFPRRNKRLFFNVNEFKFEFLKKMDVNE